PRYLVETPWLVVATFAIIVLAKPLAALLIVLVLGYAPKIALAVAAALAQIGEFSFILAALAKNLGLLPDAASNALIAAAIVSISLTPLLYRMGAPCEAWPAPRPRLWRWLPARSPPRPAPKSVASAAHAATQSARPRAVVVGYGPVGRTLTRLLRDD